MTQNNANNANNINPIIAKLDAGIALAKATNRSADLPAPVKVLGWALLTPEPVGKKAASAAGTKSTAEDFLTRLSDGGPAGITRETCDQIRSLVEFLCNMVPKNEFEQNVMGHTIVSIDRGTVSPLSASFMVWAGKVWKDRLACAAAEQEAAQAADTMPAGGKLTLLATFQGCRRLTTSYGVNYVHEFLADDGKVLEWWTDRPWGYDSATNPDAPKAGDRVSLTCRFKKPSVFRGKVTYRVTHAKFKAI